MGPQTRGYVCRPPPPAACPPKQPRRGASCRHEGLRCSYGSCGGAVATCVEGRFTVDVVSPPPSAAPDLEMVPAP